MNADEIKSRRMYRIVFEALLIDIDTPIDLFTQLFGVERDVVEDYIERFGEIFRKPRMDIYEHIESKRRDLDEYEIKKSVFEQGWGIIDVLYNQGRLIDPIAETEKLFKTYVARAGRSIHRSKNPSSNIIRNIVTFQTSELNKRKVLGGSVSEEEWDFCIQASKSSKHSHDVLTAIDTVATPVVEEESNDETNDN